MRVRASNDVCLREPALVTSRRDAESCPLPLEKEKSRTNIFSSSADIIIIITLDHHESGDGPVISEREPDRQRDSNHRM